MKKILYVDVPFIDNPAAAGQRSRHLWQLLSTTYDADLLLIKTPEYLTKPSAEHSGYNQIYTLTTSFGSILKPQIIYQFTKDNLDRFALNIGRKRYEMIVFRYLNCNELITVAAKALPGCNIIIDVDVLPSKTAFKSWQMNPNWKNWQSNAEFFKLKYLENKTFSQPYHFFFSSQQDKELALLNTGLPKDSANFNLLLNALPTPKPIETTPQNDIFNKAAEADKYILFYGDLDNAANEDAFLYLAKEIYPRISRKLQEKDIKIYVVGDHPKPVYDQFSGGRIKLIKSSAKLSEYLQECLFVILPLRMEVDAENRVIQAALYQKTVLTTVIGAEGLEIGTEEIAIENKLEAYCNRLISMLQAEDKTREMGRLLAKNVQSTYDNEAIDAGWLDYLNALFQTPVTDTGRTKLKLALITNQLGVEQDDPGVQVYLQAQKLAEVYDVTVFCPRRNNKPKRDTIGNLTVYRLFDILNYPVEFPNLKEKTLCLDLFTHLMKQNFDLIQCYPRLNYNNALAFIASKIKETPIVLCMDGLMDYAGVFETNGRIDRDILQHTTLKWYEKLLIRNMDYVFTASDKEYAFLRKCTERLEQLPMPVKAEEQIMEFPAFREEYNIAPNAFVFVCAGEISYLNGQDIALKAFTRALPQLPEARLVFVGELDTESDFYEELAVYIEKEALENEIVFVNSADRVERMAWLKDADIRLIPARFNNAGTEAVESWMCNTPVLQSDAVDPELVVEGGNGYLFCSEDIEDLAQQMQKALAQKALLPKMAEAGKELVSERYTYDYVIKRYSNAYKKLMSISN